MGRRLRHRNGGSFSLFPIYIAPARLRSSQKPYLAVAPMVVGGSIRTQQKTDVTLQRAAPRGQALPPSPKPVAFTYKAANRHENSSSTLRPSHPSLPVNRWPAHLVLPWLHKLAPPLGSSERSVSSTESSRRRHSRPRGSPGSRPLDSTTLLAPRYPLAESAPNVLSAEHTRKIPSTPSEVLPAHESWDTRQPRSREQLAFS